MQKGVNAKGVCRKGVVVRNDLLPERSCCQKEMFCFHKDCCPLAMINVNFNCPVNCWVGLNFFCYFEIPGFFEKADFGRFPNI
jgi:hypothetical protein